MDIANPFPAPEHNHRDCVQHALEMADTICSERGLRLTAIRRRVLQLVWDSHTPVGAYDILAALGNEGKHSAPPTVYRALEFLIEADLVHRLDSLNAYVGCQDPRSSHAGQFLICRGCRSVAELDDSDISHLIDQKATGMGFTAVRQMLEIQGLCPECGQRNQS